jgi:hypothetical protein
MSYRQQVRLGKPSKSELYATLTPRERILFWLALTNFAAFCVLWLALGGYALKGGVSEGHYFLGMGKVRTEVSASVFALNILHTLSLFVTHPIGFLVWRRARRRADALNA